MLIKNEGFTLVELMISVAMVFIIANIVIPVFSEYKMKAYKTEGKFLLSEIYKAQMVYKSENDVFTACLDLLGLKKPTRHLYSYGFTSSDEAQCPGPDDKEYFHQGTWAFDTELGPSSDEIFTDYGDNFTVQNNGQSFNAVSAAYFGDTYEVVSLPSFFPSAYANFDKKKQNVLNIAAIKADNDEDEAEEKGIFFHIEALFINELKIITALGKRDPKPEELQSKDKLIKPTVIKTNI